MTHTPVTLTSMGNRSGAWSLGPPFTDGPSQEGTLSTRKGETSDFFLRTFLGPVKEGLCIVDASHSIVKGLISLRKAPRVSAREG